MPEVSKTSQFHAEAIAEAFNYRHRAKPGRQNRMDAGETTALALALEDMRTTVYEDAYPSLKARLFFPVSTDVDTGADVYSFERSDFVGEAKIIADDGFADDLPNVEVSSSKEFHKIVSVGDSFSYSIQDIRRAAFMGRPLSAKKALAARRVYERKFDKIAAFGAPAHRIGSGLLNDPDIAIQAMASAGTWATKVAADPQGVLDDMNLLVRSVNVDSKEVYEANRIIVPTAQFWLMSQTKLSAESDRTVLEAFRAANPDVQIAGSWGLLSGAGAGGLNRAMAYHATPEALEIVEPQAYEILPPESRNLAFVVNCHGRTAGGTVLIPLAAKYMDGI